MKKTTFLILFFCIVLFGILIANYYSLFTGIGNFLLVNDKIEKPVDAIIVLRGGTNFDRILESYEFFRKNRAKTIIIPKSLSDEGYPILERLGVFLSKNGQLILKEILLQLEVPADNIILDRQVAGGGTVGEALRIKKLVEEKLQYQRLIVVTSWYHTRRVKKVYSRIFKGTDVDIYVKPALTHSLYSAENWWKYRYQVLTVFEEYIKSIFDYFHEKIEFLDDFPQELEGANLNSEK